MVPRNGQALQEGRGSRPRPRAQKGKFFSLVRSDLTDCGKRSNAPICMYHEIGVARTSAKWRRADGVAARRERKRAAAFGRSFPYPPGSVRRVRATVILGADAAFSQSARDPRGAARVLGAAYHGSRVVAAADAADADSSVNARAIVGVVAGPGVGNAAEGQMLRARWGMVGLGGNRARASRRWQRTPETFCPRPKASASKRLD